MVEPLLKVEKLFKQKSEIKTTLEGTVHKKIFDDWITIIKTIDHNTNNN